MDNYIDKDKDDDIDIMIDEENENHLKEIFTNFHNSHEIHYLFQNFLNNKIEMNFFKDIDILLKNEWQELKSKITNYTNNHTISCLLMSMQDLNKTNGNCEFIYNNYDKNILLWTFLLHDIGKYINFSNQNQNFYDYYM